MVYSYAQQDAFMHLSDVYKVVNIFNVYNNSFPVVELEDYWSAYQGEIIWHNENMRQKKKDLPNNTRIKTEMDTTDKMVRLCSLCRQPEHNQTKYPNVETSST